MKKKINKLKIQPVCRRSTFETNSSSMHTLVITNYNSLTTSENLFNQFKEYDSEIEKGIPFYLLVPSDNYYGRGFSILSSSIEKIFYMIAYYNLDYNALAKIKKIINKYLPEFEGFEINVNNDPNDLFNNYLNMPMYRPENFSDAFGEIDHQSADMLEVAMDTLNKKYFDNKLTEEELLEKIIMNEEFIIIVDSDENYYLEGFLKSGVIDSSKIKYVLSERWDYDINEMTGQFKTIDELLEGDDD